MAAQVTETRKECEGGVASPAGPASDPSDRVEAPDSAWSTLRALNEAETTFVLALLRGESYDAAAISAGWRDPLTMVKVLARAHVKESITRLAPLLPDAKRAAQILAPYLMDTGITSAINDPSSAASGHTRRDLLALAGFSAVSKVEHMHASVADVMAALERRRGDNHRNLTARALPELPEHAESEMGSDACVDVEPIEAGDTESVDRPKRGRKARKS